MKKQLVIASAAIALATSMQAQDLIAGFNFDNITNATYSDLGNGGAVNDGAPANVYGSFSFTDGVGNIFPATQLSAGQNLTAGTILNSSIRVLGFNNEMSVSGGGLLAEDPGLVSADGGFFDFTVTPGSAFNNYSFGFAAGQQIAGSSDLEILANANGGGFVSLDNVTVTTLSSSGGDAFVVDASSIGSASNVIFRVAFTDIDAGVLFDNIQVSGTVVPEPSAFATIAGALALAFVACRRRK